MRHGSSDRVLVGYRGVVDAGRGRGPCIRLVRVGTGGARSAERRRKRLRHPLRRGLRAVRAVRAHAPPPLDRLGAHRAGGGPPRRPRDRALPRDPDRGARAPASTRGSACITSRCPVGSPRSAKATSSTSAPVRTSGRGTSRSAPRRSATSSTAGSRSTNPARTRRCTGPADVRRAASTGDACSTSLEGVLLAQRDAWRELRGGGAPVATIHNLSPDLRGRRDGAGDASRRGTRTR